MKINRNNYEAYFLDYRENNLSPEQVAELLIFLEQNPELQSSFEAYERIELEADNSVKFTAKQNLKKSEVVETENIKQENYEEIMIAKFEGELSGEKNEELKTFLLANPKLKLEYNLLRSTFLKPDETTVYANKESLKKRGVFLLYRTPVVYGLAAAATIIILLGVYFGFLKQNQLNTLGDRDTIVLNKIEIVQPQLVGGFAELSEIELRNSVNIAKPAIIENIKILEIEKEDHMIATLAPVPAVTIDIPEYSAEISGKIKPRNNEILAVNDIKPEDKHDQKSFFGRFVSGLAGKLINTENTNKKSFIEYTVDSFNFLADQDVLVDKQVDENGKVVAYNINGNNINFQKVGKRKQAD